MRIDAHQHYWDTNAFDYGWSRAGSPALDRPFLPADLRPYLAEAGIDRTVTVQVLHTVDETAWLLDLARDEPSICGVVGWVDLQAPPDDVEPTLADLRRDPKLVGIRHLVHEEPDDDWLARPAVIRGLAVLERHDVPYDLLLRPQHLRHVPMLSAASRPSDGHRPHRQAAHPRGPDGAVGDRHRAAATNPNVVQAVGMITEADHERWSADDLAPYVEVVLDAFGVDRLMYGSDWPVCTLAGSYDRVIGALRMVLGSIDPEVEARTFGGSAAQFYGILAEEDRP
jgi:L-fuconolactonase